MSNVKKYFLCLLVITLVVGAGVGSYLYADSRNSSEEMNELSVVAHSNNVNDSAAVTKASTGAVTKNSSGTVNKVSAETATNNNVAGNGTTGAATTTQSGKLPVDIQALQKANPDIVAWVTVPGTVIDYPICQHPTDDSYYLKHGPEGMKSSHGCPFIEVCDSKTFQDYNTVVYGHNMNDGSMFAGLHKFENKKFLDEHREITVTTADHVMTYKIFAAVMYSDKYIPYYFDDTKKADRTAFIKSLSTDIVKKRSIVLSDEKVTDANKVITLSTCDKKLRDKRFIVVGVLKQIDGADV
jgi:sortase B